MCNPAAFAVGTQVVGGLQSAQGSQETGTAQKNYYSYLAAQNQVEATDTLNVAGKNVSLVQDAAARTAANFSRQVKGVEGTQAAAEGASGISGSATAEDIARDTATKAELDRAAIRKNADLTSSQVVSNAQNQAAALRRQADSYRFAGANAEYAGDINAKTALLNTATNVSNSWYKWGQTSQGK